MQEFIKNVSEVVTETLNAHGERARYDIENEAHGLHMALVDFMVWAKVKGINFSEELEMASGTFSECYSDEDFL